MISNKSDATTDCNLTEMEQISRRKIRCRRAATNNRKEQDIHNDPQSSFQAPVFNIHIHVPPYKGKNLQMYLPRIQPVIHLHFDELARKLEISRGENEESTYRMFQNLISMTSPKFGDVKFYYDDKSREKGFKESEADTTVPCSSRNVQTDCDPLVNTVIGNSSSTSQRNREIIDWCAANNSSNFSVKNIKRDANQRNKSTEKQSMSDLEKNFKLKKAVVVLTDICKSKYYKNLIGASASTKNDGTNTTAAAVVSTVQEDESCGVSGETESEEERNKKRWSNVQECNECSIKHEKSPTPEFYVPEKKIEIMDTSFMNTTNWSKEVENDKSDNNVSCGVTKSLVSLAEGCNFSDILHRFRVKQCEEYLVDSIKNLNNTSENSINNNNNESETNKQDSFEESKLVIDEDVLVDDFLGDLENEPIIEDFSLKFNTSTADNPNDQVEEGFGEVEVHSNSSHNVTDANSDNEVVYVSDDDDDEDDENDLLELHSNRRIVRATASSEIEILSCNGSPYLIPVNRFKFIQSDEKSDWSSNLQLELIKKEMARRRKNNSGNNKRKSGKVLKKKAPETRSSDSEAKKTKRSNQEKTFENSSNMGEYIPLEASGPTRFAVAQLNKVNPFKSHDARNFKNKMLFGNRVNRFPTSDHLRIYKMKKNAARKSSN